jgi:hypothetical protein
MGGTYMMHGKEERLNALVAKPEGERPRGRRT